MNDSKKLLIIHMDDIGMSHAANMAAKDLFVSGYATSASIMIPCPWACDFVRWSVENPGFDVGIHFTLTCEWQACRWRALTGSAGAAGLQDPMGFMFGSVDELKSVSAGQVKAELEKQVERAAQWGLKPSHFDSHMCFAEANEELFQLYLELAAYYKVAAHIPNWALWSRERRQMVERLDFPIVNDNEGSGMKARDYTSVKEAFYKDFDNLKPGLNVITIHPVADTPEIRAIIPSWEERHMEYRVFMDPETGKALKDCGAELITWKEAMHR